MLRGNKREGVGERGKEGREAICDERKGRILTDY